MDSEHLTKIIMAIDPHIYTLFIILKKIEKGTLFKLLKNINQFIIIFLYHVGYRVKPLIT